jgi:hypothetical protein
LLIEVQIELAVHTVSKELPDDAKVRFFGATEDIAKEMGFGDLSPRRFKLFEQLKTITDPIKREMLQQLLVEKKQTGKPVTPNAAAFVPSTKVQIFPCDRHFFYRDGGIVLGSCPHLNNSLIARRFSVRLAGS